MKTFSTFLALMCLALTSCENNPQGNKAENADRNAASGYTGAGLSESSADRTITENIRRLLKNDETLSTAAKNINITTMDGKVVLRGTVDTAAEKSAIYDKAKQVPNVKSVDNKIEIAG